ncbi:MAG: hypothetical protein V7K67_20275 [Nostoc sp.]|uniref:hypothetical protein n=1 Tax=Nostoc sp. TaxID=1180 RepID=UPI002FF107CD
MISALPLPSGTVCGVLFLASRISFALRSRRNILQQIAIKHATDKSTKTNVGLCFTFVAGLIENCCNQKQVPYTLNHQTMAKNQIKS